MTTNPHPSEQRVAEVVAGLSEAQRAAFLRSDDANMHPTNAGRISTYGDVTVAHELHRLGLIQRATTFSLATPLGLAVRASLLSNKDQ